MLQGIREIAASVNPMDFKQQNWLEEPHPGVVPAKCHLRWYYPIQMQS